MSNDAWKVITPVATEPITLSDAKAYLRVDFPDDDAFIARLITRVRRRAETLTGRAFSTQTIQQEITIERPEGGELSGPIDRGPSWFHYEQTLGANPFGPSQFFFHLAMPPIQSTESTIIVNTKVNAFDAWKAFPLTTNPDGSKNMWIANTQEPAQIFFQNPVTANFWQFIFVCGYNASYPLPEDLEDLLFQLLAHHYDNRNGENPDELKALEMQLLSKRVASAWI